MALEATLATTLGVTALALNLASIGLMLYVRAKSRASLIVDTLMRTAVPLALAQAILFWMGGASLAGSMGWPWVAVQAIFFGLSLYLLVPSVFLARISSQTDGFVIISRGLLEGLHVKLDQMYGPAPARIINYSVGKQAGFADTANAIKSGVLPPGGLWRWLPYIFRLTGLGRVKYKHLDSGKEVNLVVRNSFEVFTDHEHGENSCDITRGYLAGIGKAMHPELECQAEETRCGQMDGGEECEFIVRWFEPVETPKQPAAGA